MLAVQGNKIAFRFLWIKFVFQVFQVWATKHYSDWVTKWQENLYFQCSVHESVHGVTVSTCSGE